MTFGIRPIASEVKEVVAVLEGGAESPEAMARELLGLVYNKLLLERGAYVLAFQLGERVWTAQGLYPSLDGAYKDLAQSPMAQIAKRAMIAPLGHPRATSKGHDVASTGDWKTIREDAEDFKSGKRKYTRGRR